MRTLSLAAALAVAAAASPLQAQAADPTAAQPIIPNRAELMKKIDTTFDEFDTNNDGFVSRDEMQNAEARAMQKLQAQVDQKANEQFTKLDTDKNGQLSPAEFKAGLNLRPNQTPDQVVARYDSNKDGKVSQAEFRAPVAAAFDRGDLDKNGVLSPEEQAKLKAARGQ